MKVLLDLLPLIAFFTVYKLEGLMAATAALMIATFISLGIIYVKERRIAMNPLISGVLVGVFGGLTLLLQNDLFIKMKPTIVNLLFAAILLGGLYFRKPLLKPLLGAAFQLTDEGWYKLTLRWGFYFIFLAGLNEFIWRNFSEEFWVSFKVFGMLPLTISFTILQMPLIKRHMVKTED